MIVTGVWGGGQWGVSDWFGVSVWNDEKVLGWIVVMVIQQCECT